MIFSAKSLAAATLVAVSLLTFQGQALAQKGRASWYAMTSKTASGERCDPNALTAAHRSLPRHQVRGKSAQRPHGVVAS